jgi:hypothetical protein
VGKDLGPVVSLVPRYLRRRVDFDRHHLTHGSALDQYYRRADPACASAASFATLNVCATGESREVTYVRGTTCMHLGESVIVTNGKDRMDGKGKRELTADWGHLMDVG